MTGHNRDNKVPADHLKVKRSIDKAEARRREEWVEKTIHNIEVLEEADWRRNEELANGDRDFGILKRWVYASLSQKQFSQRKLRVYWPLMQCIILSTTPQLIQLCPSVALSEADLLCFTSPTVQVYA